MAEDAPPPIAPRRTLLEWFSNSTSSDLPNSRLATALQHHDGEAWHDWLMRAADVLGWEGDQVEASPSAVGGDRDSWWVTCGKGGQERWLVISGARGEEAHASLIDGIAARDLPLESKALAAALELDDPDERITWVRLTLALPLEPLRSPPGGDKLAPMRRLFRWTKLERRTVLAVLAYSTIIGAVSLAVPLAVQSLVNVLAFGRLLQPLLVISVALLIVLSLAAGLRVLEVYIVELLQRRAFCDLSRDVARRLSAAAPTSGGPWGLTERINRFFDIVSLQKSASTLLLSATEIVMSTVAGLFVLAFYHPYLLVFDLVLIGTLGFVVFQLGKGGIDTAVEESHSKYELAAWLESVARQQRRFLAPEGGGWAVRQTDRLAVQWLDDRADHFKIVLRQTIGFASIQAIASAGLLGLGSFLVWNKQLTLGQLVAAELIITAVLAQLAKFGKHVETFYDLNASVEKIGMLVDLETEATSGELLPVRSEGIEVTSRELHLANKPFPIRAAPGERVGVVGLPQQHRAALLDVLYGARAPESGNVLLDDSAVTSLAPRQLRHQVKLVGDGMPVGAPLEDNLTSQDARSTPDENRTLLRSVGLGSLVSELPEGLQTWIYPTGEPLNYSQLVALEVARAVRGRPRLLLINGVLDHIDSDRLDELWPVIAEPDTRWTLIIATDRPDLVRRCDRVYRWHEKGLQEASP